ncbi:unnamed protein product [Phytophthora lilii]|uniref:Unnamed protein product n=1 Tax=Phytophthora lilii TaxID=2077276 RepID=A0A9W6TG53_9STRA|nr:unnamed protein product [Phytophthora lilii]
MASWQRYPGAWTAEEEAARLAGRGAATAPPLGLEQEGSKENARLDQAPHFYGARGYGMPPPAFQQEEARRQQVNRQNLPGYPSVPSQGYTGYPGDVQERYDPMQWTYQGQPPRQAPVQQSTSARGQWVTLNQQENRQGPWIEGPEPLGGLQLHRGHERWGHWRRHGGPSSQRGAPGFLVATLKLGVYHAVNVIFALVACGILSAGICSAASLIPVCCIGLLIFQVLVYIVFSLAQWDIKLANYIAPAHQCAYANLLPPGRFIGREGLSGYRISPSLAFFSPLSLMAMLYFVLVKPVIGALSLLSLLLVVAPTVSFIASLTPHHYDAYYDSIEVYGVGPMSMSRYPGLSLVGAICVTLLGVALMQLVAKISQGATRFFCCEKFAVTTRFAPYQYQSLTSDGVTSYGATSTRS